jgi:hypothetical protein
MSALPEGIVSSRRVWEEASLRRGVLPLKECMSVKIPDRSITVRKTFLKSTLKPDEPD